MTSTGVSLGIDLGGTKALASARCDGAEVWSLVEPTGRELGPRACVALVSALVRAASDAGHEPDRIGVGFPGLVDPATSTVRSSVILDGWVHVPLRDLLESALGLPCALDNDVNNAARAELAVRSPAGRTGPDLLFVSVGTGIGGALVLGGEVWRGVDGLAGEVGHMVSAGARGTCRCGRAGCVSGVASGRSIDAARREGERESDAFGRAADHLGAVIADSMALLNLPLVTIGGGVAERPGFVEQVAAAFHHRAIAEIGANCRVEASVAGYSAAAHGAALLAERSPEGRLRGRVV